jgi:hypothetical protein
VLFVVFIISPIVLILLQQKVHATPAQKKVGGILVARRQVAVDSAASTCNHAIHEFFVSTSSYLPGGAADSARPGMDVISMNAASIQVAFFLARRDRGLNHRI